MNGNTLNTDGYTSKLIKIAGKEEPSADFTKNVMGKILKDPLVEVNFISKDDEKSNIWLFLSIGVMIVGYAIYYLEFLFPDIKIP